MKSIEEVTNKIVCGDCLEVMKNLPSESIDLVVTSPLTTLKTRPATE